MISRKSSDLNSSKDENNSFESSYEPPQEAMTCIHANPDHLHPLVPPLDILLTSLFLTVFSYCRVVIVIGERSPDITLLLDEATFDNCYF